MKEIPLTQGKVALVDDDDFEWLSQFKWYAVKFGRTFYAVRQAPRVNGKQRTIWMHREVLGLKPGDPRVDHRDGDGLNNQRMNLREATHRQNMMNSRGRSGSSRFKGVDWDKRAKKWRARISVNGKKKHLGYFIDEEEAARAYDEKAKKIFGEFARVNFEKKRA